jgi:hypothetical protein
LSGRSDKLELKNQMPDGLGLRPYEVGRFYFMKTKYRYLALTSLEGRDELYRLTPRKTKLFESKFGRIDGYSFNDHNGALDWVRNNCKKFDFCTCLAYE